MMRVSFKLAGAQHGVTEMLLAAACAVLLGACSSSAIDPTGEEAPSGDTGGSAATGGTASAGATPPAAEPDYRKQDYPPGPYGTGIGATLENYAFLGWRDPLGAAYDLARLEPVHLAEFYNPDGRSDTRYLWI